MEDGGDPKTVVEFLERSLQRSKQRPHHGEVEGHRSSSADLEELRTSIMDASADVYYPTFTYKPLRKQLMELSYDIEDYLDMTLLLRRRSSLTAQHFSQLSSRLQDAKKICESSSNQQPCRDSSSVLVEAVEEDDDDRLVAKPQDLKEAVKKLASMLAFEMDMEHEQQLKVVPIFGPARVGKTRLARTMCLYYGGRFQCRAFLAALLSQIKGPQPERFDVHHLIDNIKQHLYGKSYFIVIDDLWSTPVWDLIRQAFPEGNCSSRIIITTQIEDIAMDCCGCCKDNIYNMGAHSGDHKSKQLFIHTYERTKEIINLSYNNLVAHLKKCLLYLKMYPEDFVIRKDDLVKQWVAKGFVIGGTGNIWEVAAGYFDDLVTRGMIQPFGTNYNGEVLSCTVDQIVSDLIAERSEDENFVTIVNGSETNALLSDKVRRLSVNFGGAKGAQIPDSFRVSQVRSLMFSGFFKCVPSIVEYPLLRVLILHIWTDQDKTTFDLTKINKLFRLRYLKIDCNMTVQLPVKIRQLQYLETLEIYARVAVVPLDIVLLKHLIHLHLPTEIFLHNRSYMGTSILVSLLHTLGNMNSGSTNTTQSSTNTTCFNYSLLLLFLQCHIGQHNCIRFPTSLRSLSSNISTSSKYSVLNLRKLTNLQNLHLTCSGVPDKRVFSNMGHLPSILEKLSYLKSLILDGGLSSSMIIPYDGLNSIKFPQDCLERLDLSPRVLILSSLQRLVGKLSNLCTLKIAVKELSSADVSILERLSALTALSLYVRSAPEARIQFNQEGFLVLKYFKFICAAPCLKFNEGAMHKVQLVMLGFNANTIQQYNLVNVGFENMKGLQVISAKIGGTDADEPSKVVAKHNLVHAFTMHPCHPIINIKLVNSSFDGDNERGSAHSVSRIGPDEHGTGENDSTEDFNKLANSRIITISSEYSSHNMLNPGVESWKPKDQGRLIGTVQGLTYMTSKSMKSEELRVKNEITSIKLEMDMMAAVLDGSPGLLPDEWVLQMQDLSYEVEDFIDIYSWLSNTRSWSHILAHIRHAVHLRERVTSLQEWQHRCTSRYSRGRSATSSQAPLPSGSYISEDVLIGIDEQMAELRELMMLPHQYPMV